MPRNEQNCPIADTSLIYGGLTSSVKFFNGIIQIVVYLEITQAGIDLNIVIGKIYMESVPINTFILFFLKKLTLLLMLALIQTACVRFHFDMQRNFYYIRDKKTECLSFTLLFGGKPCGKICYS